MARLEHFYIERKMQDIVEAAFTIPFGVTSATCRGRIGYLDPGRELSFPGPYASVVEGCCHQGILA
jgi:hypothetical protein